MWRSPSKPWSERPRSPATDGDRPPAPPRRSRAPAPDGPEPPGRSGPKERKLQQVLHWLTKLLRWRYGQQRERVDEHQLFLFAAAAVETHRDVPPRAPAGALAPAAHTGHGRQRLPQHLERRHFSYELPPEQRQCPHCQAQLQRMGPCATGCGARPSWSRHCSRWCSSGSCGPRRCRPMTRPWPSWTQNYPARRRGGSGPRGGPGVSLQGLRLHPRPQPGGAGPLSPVSPGVHLLDILVIAS